MSYLPLLFDVPCCCILTNAPNSPQLVLDGSEQTQADALSCLCSVTIVVVMLLPAISIEPTMADDDVVVFVLHDDDDDDVSFGFLRGGWSSSQEVPVDAIEFVSLSILMMKIMPKNEFANNFCSPFHNAHKTQFQYICSSTHKHKCPNALTILLVPTTSRSIANARTHGQ